MTSQPTYAQLEQMYFDQCAATDAWAAKVQEHGDAALKERIRELEQQLATVNAHLIAANTQTESRSFCFDGRPDQIKKMFDDMQTAALVQLNSDWGDAAPEKKNV